MSSAPQSEQKNFKDVLVASLGATVPPPVVKLRLTTEDVARADLRQPGTLTKLLKQLNRPQQPHQQKRMSRGSACQRCRLMKRRCDGRSPCISCILSGETCTNSKQPAEPTTLESAESLSQALSISSEPPMSHGHLVPSLSPKPAAAHPQRPSLGAMTSGSPATSGACPQMDFSSPANTSLPSATRTEPWPPLLGPLLPSADVLCQPLPPPSAQRPPSLLPSHNVGFSACGAPASSLGSLDIQALLSFLSANTANASSLSALAPPLLDFLPPPPIAPALPAAPAAWLLGGVAWSGAEWGRADQS